METIKALSLQDTHFFFAFDSHTIDVDAIKVILLWNESPSSDPLSTRYEALRATLSNLFQQELDLANTYLIFEKSCAIVASLKKNIFTEPSLKS